MNCDDKAAASFPKIFGKEQELIHEIRAEKSKHEAGKAKKKSMGSAAGTTAAEEPRATHEAAGESGSSGSDPVKDGAESQLVGLALSGGGIRSATFNLGVLQALAELNLLPRIDYLSTVSGGGYIGSWLVAWLHRNNAGSDASSNGKLDPAAQADEVCRKLHPDWKDQGPRVGGVARQEPPPIQFLREYSNYLTPRLGYFGADTWAPVAIIVRNLLLNLTILILALSSVLLLPRAITRLSDLAMRYPDSCLVTATVLVAIGIFFIGLNLRSFTLQSAQHGQSGKKGDAKTEEKCPLYARPKGIAILMFAVFLGAWFATNWIGALARTESKDYQLPAIIPGGEALARAALHDFLPAIAVHGLARIVAHVRGHDWFSWAVWGTIVYFSAWFLGWIGGLAPERGGRERHVKTLNPLNWRATLVSAVGAGAVGGVLLWTGYRLLFSWSHADAGHAPWRGVTLGPAVMVAVFCLTVTLHIGLMGLSFPDEKREWLARAGALLLLFAVGWVALFAIAIVGPTLVTTAAIWLRSAAVTAWVVSTIAGLAAGMSSSTGDKTSENWKMSIVTTVTPYIFVVGLLLILSYGVHGVMAGFHGAPVAHAAGSGVHWNLESESPSLRLFVYALALFGIAFLLSSRVDINEFSMHMLYRNRLVRCYLGASNCGRRGQPFTGFDAGDDILLKEFGEKKGGKLQYVGPYPIINATLNLVKGQDLAWQERKAESFIFTPFYSGFDATPSEDGCHDTPVDDCLEPGAYRPTSKYGYGDGGPYLGTALAISGAAASPNMGYYSSPALGFLMTVFNVRLGWWFGNPRYGKNPLWGRTPFWQRPGPRVGLFYLIYELLGLTNDQRPYVYLSDGGHFENLALYELVRRRCRFIIACDAGADPDMKFSDLGNAIEKCRVDFGIDIEIDVKNLRRNAATSLSTWHCAVGKIHYEDVDPEVPPGVLLYLKPSLTGDEPADVLRYKAEHAEFPDQSTADQWFNEDQFESYRALGEQIAEQAFLAVGEREELKSLDIEDLLVRLRQHWYPSSANIQASFTKHTATFAALLEKMRNDKNLHFLDAQVYPEWPELSERKAKNTKDPQYWLPDKEEELRSGFYFCNEMIQLFEDSYIDLDLEAEYDHPDNRGWINLFLHWSWSGMFCATWAIAAGTYGARFQTFCERRLDLGLGSVEIGKPIELSDDEGETERILKEAEKEADTKDRLSFWEAQLIRAFLKSRKSEARHPLSKLQILPFLMKVCNPRDHACGDPIRFWFGFALARIAGPRTGKQTAEIVYFRIRNHIRKMGLARRALIELNETYTVENAIEVVSDQYIRDFRETEKGDSILEALPTKEARLEFDRALKSILNRTSRRGTSGRRDSGR